MWPPSLQEVSLGFLHRGLGAQERAHVPACALLISHASHAAALRIGLGGATREQGAGRLVQVTPLLRCDPEGQEEGACFGRQYKKKKSLMVHHLKKKSPT